MARLAQKIAANATAITAVKPKNQAAAAATTGATMSTENMMSCGARDLSQDPMTIAKMLPPATAPARAPSAKCLETPKRSLCSTNTKKKSVKPEKARSTALPVIASVTAGPTRLSVRQ